MLQIVMLEIVWCIVVLGLIGLVWPLAYRQKKTQPKAVRKVARPA